MKPVGLDNPRTGRWPYAVVQLRQDNELGTLWNMVGFQTKLKHGEQMRIFRTIPGLEKAEFARLGGIHRNTFINSPRLLDDHAAVEVETAISALPVRLLVARGMSKARASASLLAALRRPSSVAKSCPPPPVETALGALLGHITGGADAETFQPMNVNFGLMPPPPGRARKADRKKAYTDRARTALAGWLEQLKVSELA